MTVSTAVMDSVRLSCETLDDDRPFIVLTETKFSFRCIPVWIGTLLFSAAESLSHLYHSLTPVPDTGSSLSQGCRFRQCRRSQPGPKAENVSSLTPYAGSGIEC